MTVQRYLKCLKGFDSQSDRDAKTYRCERNYPIRAFTFEHAKGSCREALYRLADNQVEALQFRVQKNEWDCGIPLSELKTNRTS